MSSKKKWKAAAASRDAGGFVAMPWAVLDSAAYQALGHPAKALLMEFARQYVRDNNGRLLASMAYLKERGWRSNSLLTRTKKELMEAGFIHETAKGQRPSKASWYAVTWAALDRIPGYDTGAAETFQRGAYRLNAPLTPTPRPISKTKAMTKTPAISDTNGYELTPPQGALGASTAPPQGVEGQPTAPPQGAVKGGFDHSSTPPHGDHLENHLQTNEGSGAVGMSDQRKIANVLNGKPDGGMVDQGSYQRLVPKPKRLFTGLLLAEHQPNPEQVMQLAVQRAAQAARKAVAP